MTIRNLFEEELKRLKNEVVRLAEKVENAFQRSIEAVQKDDVQAMDEIIEADEEINDLELTINENATLLIAKQQPVASDLRKIVVCLKVSSYLERIGDLTVDIAKAGKRLHDNKTFKQHEAPLWEMAEKANKMIREAIVAFDAADIFEAQKIAAEDDEIDRAYGAFVKSLFNMQIENNDDVEQLTQLAFISRYVERIADYCTNISEWIIYEVNGKRIDLN